MTELDKLISSLKNYKDDPISGAQVVDMLEKLRNRMQLPDAVPPTVEDEDIIRNAISAVLEGEFEVPPIVGQVVVLCELHHVEEGERGPYMFTFQTEDLPWWSELGMLEYRAASIKARIEKDRDE